MMTVFLRHLVVGIVSIKFFAVTVGYVGFVITSPTGARARRNYLEHARHVMEKRSESGELSPEAHIALERDFAHVQKNIASGWRTSEEVTAFARILHFAFVTDARMTAVSVRELGEHCGKGLWEYTRRYFPPPPDNHFSS